MKITIITPCSRPENLLEMLKSIDFEKIHEWIIVYDGLCIAENLKKFDHPKIKEFVHTAGNFWGNPQRNFALEQIQEDDTFVYFLDDDNIIHPDFYKITSSLESNKIYTFNQFIKSQNKIRLGNLIAENHIDTAQFLIYYSLCKNIKWGLNYSADFHFLNACISNNPNAHVFINKILSYYNFLK